MSSPSKSGVDCLPLLPDLDRDAFTHVIQAAADVVEDELVVVGSQALLGSLPTPPASLIRSQEVDLYPRTDPTRAIEIDGAIGDGSPFHQANGYYGHGVGPETITAPAGWEERLVRYEAPPIRRRQGPAVGWCLSLPDLLLAKLAAGREHDLSFVADALREQLASAGELKRGIDLMPEQVRDDVRTRLQFAAAISRRG